MLTFIILTIFFLVTSRDVNLYNFKAVNFEGILIIRLIEIWWQIQILDWWGLGWQKDPDTSHDYFSFKTRNKINCHILNNNWNFFIIPRFLRKSNLKYPPSTNIMNHLQISHTHQIRLIAVLFHVKRYIVAKNEPLSLKLKYFPDFRTEKCRK